VPIPVGSAATAHLRDAGGASAEQWIRMTLTVQLQEVERSWPSAHAQQVVEAKPPVFVQTPTSPPTKWSGIQSTRSRGIVALFVTSLQGDGRFSESLVRHGSSIRTQNLQLGLRIQTHNSRSGAAICNSSIPPPSRLLGNGREPHQPTLLGPAVSSSVSGGSKTKLLGSVLSVRRAISQTRSASHPVLPIGWARARLPRQCKIRIGSCGVGGLIGKSDLAS
jgi:hypothetical protein